MQATDGAVMDDFDMDLDVRDGSTIVSRLRLPVDLAIENPYERISNKQRGRAPAQVSAVDAGPLNRAATRCGLR